MPSFSPIHINPECCSIDEVIDQLGCIIDWAEAENSCLGYFPALYQAVTIRVAKGIKMQRFADGGGMERLDVVFANRYFQALDLYLRGEQPTESWKIAFDQGQEDGLIVLQHLLLGINAHINLDLGLATAKIAKERGSLERVEGDFLEINKLLREMTNQVQGRLNGFSLIWKSVDFMLGKTDELLANFSLKQARQYAWKLAEEAYLQPDPYAPHFIRKQDQEAKAFSQLILRPPNLTIWAGMKIMGKISFNEARNVIQELRKPY
ncbi:MAG: DUF5995 family protein [Bacteroidota bacterium]